MGGIRACGKAGSVHPVQHSERSARQITNGRHMRGYVVVPAGTTPGLIAGKCVGSPEYRHRRARTVSVSREMSDVGSQGSLSLQLRGRSRVAAK
jgi:hypothetical protein